MADDRLSNFEYDTVIKLTDNIEELKLKNRRLDMEKIGLQNRMIRFTPLEKFMNNFIIIGTSAFVCVLAVAAKVPPTVAIGATALADLGIIVGLNLHVKSNNKDINYLIEDVDKKHMENSEEIKCLERNISNILAKYNCEYHSIDEYNSLSYEENNNYNNEEAKKRVLKKQ